MSHLYYHPEEYGLEAVAEYEAHEPDCSFDLVCVWRDREGKLWAASDSGCSCPVPFEDHTFPTDFTEVHSTRDVKVLVEGFDGYRTRKPAVGFLNTVRAALRQAHA